MKEARKEVDWDTQRNKRKWSLGILEDEWKEFLERLRFPYSKEKNGEVLIKSKNR